MRFCELQPAAQCTGTTWGVYVKHAEPRATRQLNLLGPEPRKCFCNLHHRFEDGPNLRIAVSYFLTGNFHKRTKKEKLYSYKLRLHALDSELLNKCVFPTLSHSAWRLVLKLETKQVKKKCLFLCITFCFSSHQRLCLTSSNGPCPPVILAVMSL